MLIDKGTPGFTTGNKLRKMGWWASDTAELFFEDCRVPADRLIGAENAGFIAIMSNFLAERLSLSVMAYMTAQIAYEAALDYTRQRQAFGRPVAGGLRSTVLAFSTPCSVAMMPTKTPSRNLSS